jgi:hypothetical protein
VKSGEENPDLRQVFGLGADLGRSSAAPVHSCGVAVKDAMPLGHLGELIDSVKAALKRRSPY